MYWLKEHLRNVLTSQIQNRKKREKEVREMTLILNIESTDIDVYIMNISVLFKSDVS